MLNLPNLLTMLRFGCIPVYGIVFFSDSPYNMLYALLVLALAGLTDVIDGYLARTFDWVTELGSMLDPLADKLMMLAVILSLVIDGRVSWWATGLMVLREVGMIVTSVFFVSQGKKTVPAMFWGKATTVLMYLALVALLLRWPHAEWLLWGVLVVAFGTSCIYLQRFRALNVK
jgi:cardiolipin synthase